MSKTHINIDHLAKLAELSVGPQEAKDLGVQLESTLEAVSTLDELNTTEVEPTSQVTGLTNVCRNDQIDRERMFSQEQALAHAQEVYQGYFVVSQLIES